MADVKVTLPRDDYSPNQRTDIDVEVVNSDGTTSTRTVKGAVQSITQEDGTVTFGIMASAHVPFAADTSYEDAVLADSPLAYWRMNDGSGSTMADSSGNSRDGTYYYSPTLSSSGGPVTGGGYATFNGTSQYATAAVGAWAQTDTFTVEFWAKHSSGASTTKQCVIARGDYDRSEDASDQVRVQYIEDETFEVRTTRANGSEWLNDFSSASVTDTDWHHVVVVCSGSAPSATTDIYIDGSLDSSNAMPTDFNFTDGDTSSPFTVAYQTAPGFENYYDGSIAEVAFYDTALSSTRIAAHYNAA